MNKELIINKIKAMPEATARQIWEALKKDKVKVSYGYVQRFFTKVRREEKKTDIAIPFVPAGLGYINISKGTMGPDGMEIKYAVKSIDGYEEIEFATAKQMRDFIDQKVVEKQKQAEIQQAMYPIILDIQTAIQKQLNRTHIIFIIALVIAFGFGLVRDLSNRARIEKLENQKIEVKSAEL